MRIPFLYWHRDICGGVFKVGPLSGMWAPHVLFVYLFGKRVAVRRRA